MKLGSVIENPKDVLEVRIEFIHGDAEFYSKEIVRFKRNSVLHHIFCLIYDNKINDEEVLKDKMIEYFKCSDEDSLCELISKLSNIKMETFNQLLGFIFRSGIICSDMACCGLANYYDVNMYYYDENGIPHLVTDFSIDKKEKSWNNWVEEIRNLIETSYLSEGYPGCAIDEQEEDDVRKYNLANKLLNIETSDVLIEIVINEEESFVLENPFACRFLFDSLQCFLDLLNNIFSKLRQQDNKIVIKSHEHKNLVLEFKI